jgi:hypothetical protein
MAQQVILRCQLVFSNLQANNDTLKGAILLQITSWLATCLSWTAPWVNMW